MEVEHRILAKASPEVIFAIYQDVESWHTWDPDTKRASISGPFRIGTRGKLTPTKGNTVPMLLTHVVPGKCFTVESRIPFFRLLFEHELNEGSGSTEIVHRVTLSGALSLVIGKALAKQIDAGLPVTLQRLKLLAEARCRTEGEVLGHDARRGAGGA